MPGQFHVAVHMERRPNKEVTRNHTHQASYVYNVEKKPIATSILGGRESVSILE